MKLNNNLYAVILAGGVGSRFWPFSREFEPKQFMKVIGNRSLLEDTISRIRTTVNPRHIYIVSNKIYFYELKKQINKFLIPDENIVLEPQGKNTAPAVGLCAKLISDINPDAILAVLPSDHYIKDFRNFRNCLRRASECALDDYLVTIGIKPAKASTGYGYIKVKSKIKNIRQGNAVARSRQELWRKRSKQKYLFVEKFLEKPSLGKAKKYAASKDYFWNSGMFVWKASVFMEELRAYLPQLYSHLVSIKSRNDIEKAWRKITPVSVDYGIMEHSNKIVLLPADFDWTDLGSWDALNDILPKDSKGNVIQADVIDYESRGICVFGRSNRLIGTIGLKDLIIADTPDALLACHKDKAQEVRRIVDNLKSRHRKEYMVHMTDRRPWGSYTVLQRDTGFKIKLVEIDPGKRLSLQKHSRRAEHWVVVSGCARVTYGKTVKLVKSNQSIYIPKGVKHRLENPTSLPLQIVEVQTGRYLEEDDIERFEDDFQR